MDIYQNVLSPIIVHVRKRTTYQIVVQLSQFSVTTVDVRVD